MATLPSGLPEIVADGEHLARFLTQSSHFSSVMAKPAAFMPSAKGQETSVFRHAPEPLPDLWATGALAVARSGRSLKGVAFLKARHVREAELAVRASEPPPTHAAIEGWPWLDDPELQKAQQKERAALLAQRSQLLLV
jgi:hypothetical protein